MGSTERRQRQKEQLREQILEAARTIVVQEGFDALSMRKIADAVEYAPATLYLHFQSRDEIARELCVRGFRELWNFLAPAAPLADPLERLRVVAEGYVRFAMSHPETYRLIFMEDPKYTGTVLRGGPDDPGEQSLLLMVRAFEELQEQGRLAKDAVPRRLSEVFWAGMHGVVSLKITCSDFLQTPAEEMTTTLTRALLDGLISPATRPRAARLR
ncbi:TetR/AcrR family transcriptional regulator [Hyalangium rubrum]|uniref:TetR/AcrR family transcriptional regulator n=1 Tax=Hyalangium rubrum TaxID=3103134 RepID=A0ABU5HB33_9BACT|nr:TetR/AcrR family transcriptional regulator [Hyalangium sp. s54d21]MDY7230531.1 TetR/AcrR family transcriptional regulator [Hyalangium sp. s54d21]